MKNNKFSLFLFGLPVIILGILLSSCDTFFMPESKIGQAPQIYNSSSLSRKAELSLWHTAESHDTPVEALQDQVQAWLQPKTDTESRSRSAVTSVYSYSVIVENGFSSVPANRRPVDTMPERSVIPFYVFQLENREERTSGFAFACGDPRIGNLLALVEDGDFHDTEMPFWQIFLGCLDEYIDETITVYNGISDSDIEAALIENNTDASRSAGNDPPDYMFDKIKFDKIYEQVKLNTVSNWRQGEPYNHVFNIFAGKSNSKNYWSAGCAAVAMGHIMAYHEWPLKPPTSIRQSVDFGLFNQFISLQSKTSFYDPFSETTKTFSSITYDWKDIKYQAGWGDYAPRSYNDKDKKILMQIGVLYLAIGDKVNMKYSNVDLFSGAGAFQSDVENGWTSFGYSKPVIKDYSFNIVKDILRESKPVMMGGSKGTDFADGGHYWIIDGYRSADAITTPGGVVINNENFVHVIPGWGDSRVGWYYSDIFDMREETGPVALTDARSVVKKDYFRNNLHIFTDLYPLNNNKVVTINEVEGVWQPVAGYLPKPEVDTEIKIIETQQFTGTVEWYVPTGNGKLRLIDKGENFKHGVEYTAVISLTAKKGFTFYGVDDDFFTVNGAASSTNAANSSVITAVFPPTVSLFANGDGTSTNPFKINTVEDFNNLRQYSAAHFKLENDIDLQNIPWTPIPEFHGTLEGKDKTISNLNMTFENGVHGNLNYRDCISYGLFVLNKGTFQNLQVTANIDLTNIPGNYSIPQDREIIVGVIAAVNDGKILNCTVAASGGNPMINSTIHVRTLTGGIAGYNDNKGTINTCTNDGTILSSGSTGGIMGCNIGDTIGCVNNGTILYTYINHNSGIGGIAGGNLLGFLMGGTNNGTIVYTNASSTSQLIQPCIGQIAGSNSSGLIRNVSLNFSDGTVNLGTLQTVTYTSNGVTQTHDQALYAGNRAVGMGFAGAGTADDPFLVITEENLRHVKYSIPDFHYRLMNDIDLQNIPWTPLEYFNGVFEGNNYSISNLNMTFTDSFLVNNKTISYGLIAENRGTIRNLKVSANINLTNIPSNYTLPQNGEILVGVIAAGNYGTIQSVTVSSSNSSPMINSIVHVKNITGGISGKNYADGIITSCTNNGAIHSSGDTGGIIGNNQGASGNCKNSALIRYTYVNENRGIGGIVGHNASGSVTGGTNTGIIFYANTDTGTNTSVQPCMAHIVGYRADGAVSGIFTYNVGTVNSGSLQIVTFTSGGVTQTFDQTVFVGNRVIGKEHISGSGIVNDPYIINKDNFYYLRQFPDASFKLENDIDLSSFGTWTPIPEFTGVLDGNGKTLSNLNMTFTNRATGNYYHADRISFGLIAFNKGTVRNLKVSANINLTNIPANYTLAGNTEIVVGVIAAGNDGTIQNCTVSASSSNPMINAMIHTGNIVGGITGYNYGKVTSCINNGAIHTSLSAGGITGCNIGATNSSTNNALIRYTYNNMNSSIGGIVGSNLMGRVDGGTNNGTITYANSSNTSHLIQPAMGHIAGWMAADTEVGGTLNFSGGTLNPGTLQTVTYTSGGVTQTHNQALYAGNRAVGSGMAGFGTSSDPFLVYTVENFNIVPRFSGAHYKLMNNVDLQNVPWTTKPVFNGTFDGNNFTISNLNQTFTNSLLVNNKSISYGLFAENRGTIRNLKVSANINITNIPGSYTLPQNGEILVGVIAAGNYGIVQSCTVSASSTNPMINSTIHVRNTTGGMIGENYAGGSVSSCTNNGAINSNGATGGIIGHNRGTVSGCTNNALIRYTWVSENRGIGGIVGENTSGIVSGGVNNSTVSYVNTNTNTNTSVQPYMAHILGLNTNGTVSGTFTFSSGTVSHGTLRTVSQHNQAFFTGSRVTGRAVISGTGTTSSPYVITDASHLIYLRHFTNANFSFANDIDMSHFEVWTSIPEFTGIIEGNNKTISNLNLTFTNGVSGNYYHADRISFGLIAFNKGTVRNLKVSANINLTNIPSNYTLAGNTEIVAGVIAAGNDGTIQNCTVSASSSNPMINAVIHTGNIVGGITGYNYGKVTSCINNGAIHTSMSAGGITGCNIGVTTSGTNNALIRYTYNNMNSSIGGIVGSNLMGLVQNGTNNGTITYANSSSTSLLIQPAMGHIAGWMAADTEVGGALNFSGGTMNISTLQTVTYTSGGVTQTHNQALYAGNRAVGSGMAGFGTSSDPFLVYTAENFNIVPRFNSAHYKLMNNIDLQNVPWTTKPNFTGTFEGNNYTISNLNQTFTNSLLVNNKTISYGLFAENRGTIRNLKITANINLLTNLPSNYTLPSNREIFVGTLAAANFGTIQNVTVSSSNSNPMINSTINVKNTTGGVAGENMAGGSITTSTNNGAVYSNGGTGGIIGHNRGSTSGCTNNALIRYTWVSENRGIGGIAGENTLGTVSSGTNNGTVSYANAASTNRSIQPFMAHIVGNRISGTVSGTFNFGSGVVSQGTLQTLSSPTFNQALYVGNREVGK